MDTESALFSGRAGSGPGQRSAPRARARPTSTVGGGGLLITTGAIYLHL
jgi:hypothetical protein